MNKKAYRIVFNAHRGALMVVAENRGGDHGRGASGGTGAPGVVGGRASRSMRMAQLAVLVCALFGGVTVVSAQIVADRNAASRPVVDQSANGRPVVQIVTPNAAGVSHNRYDQFNVGQNGAILNNSGAVSQTQQAGLVAGNPALVNGSARMILNEVTGASRSQLNGYIEVAGQRADVIVANPNGISCSSCGFINTSRGVLTTGTPELASDGSLASLRVKRGDISINGMNASDIDRVDLIARSVQVNGALWANQLNVITGANLVNYANLGVQVIQGDGAPPTVGIDVAQLGGMYANRIRLIGTEAGVGVRSLGNISAQSGDFEIDNSGKITLAGNTTATGTVTIHSGTGISNSGTMYGQQNVTLTSEGQVGNSGTVAAQGSLNISGDSISASGTFGAGVDSSGNVTRAADLSLNAAATLAANGQNTAGGNMIMRGASLDLAGAQTSSAGNATLIATAGDIDHTGGNLQVAGMAAISAAGSLTNNAGTINANQLALTSANLSNRQGKIVQYGNGATQILVANTLDNSNGGTLKSNSTDLSLTPQVLNNDGGTIALAGSGQLAIRAGGVSSVGGSIGGNGAVTVVANTIGNRAGSIFSQRLLNVTAIQGAIDNSAGGAMRSATGAIVTATAAINNSGGTIEANGTTDSLTVSAASLDNSAGRISNSGTGVTQINGGSQINNRQGSLVANGPLELQAASLDNSQQGKIAASGDLTLDVATSLNNDSASITAGTTLTINAANAAVSNVGGTLSASGEIAATADSVDNTSGFIGSTAGSNVGLTNRRNLVNTGGTVASGRNLGIKANTIIGVGKLAASQDLTLNLQGDYVNEVGNVLSANHNLTFITTGQLINRASLTAVNTLSVQASGLNNQATGLINAGTTLIKVPGSIMNTGRIYGDDIALGAQSLTNDLDTASGQAGVIASRNSINIGASGIVNREHALIQSLGNMSIGGVLDANNLATGAANSITNESATIDAGGNLNLQTATLINRNNHFSTTVQEDPTLTQHVTEYADWTQPNIWYRADQVTWSDSGGGGIVLVRPDGNRFEKFYKRDYTEVVQKTVVLSSDPGKISAGGNMILSGNVTNDKSVMVAGGTLGGTAGTINNVGATGTDTTVWHMTAGQNYYHWVSGHPHTNYYTYNNGGAAYDNVQASTTSDLPVWSVQQNTNPGSSANPAASQPANGSTVPTAAGLSGSAATGNRNIQTIGGASNALPSLRLPNNRLFTLHPQPGQNYLVETDPKFTDYKTFISSDYMLGRLALDPQNIQKRLGDGFYEQKVIGDQITELTGKRILGGYASAEDQYKALMDAGVASAAKFQLTPGIALSDAQMAALTSDIVWLVAQMVTLPDGTQTSVLAPVVYLSRASTEDIKPTGTLISGKDIDLTVNGTLDNGGTLLASNSMIVRATDIKNTGTIQGNATTGDVGLVASNDVFSSGTISGNRVGILAGRDVTLASTTSSNLAANGLNTKVDQVSTVKAGQLAVQAGRDINAVAASIQTSGDANLAANRDVNLGTVKTQESYNVTFNSRNHLNESTTEVVGTSIETKGALTISAGQDLNAQAAYANAGGVLTANAARNVNIGVAQQESTLDQAIYTTSKGLFSSSTSSSTNKSATTTSVGSTFSGDSVKVRAGNDLAVTGSNIVGTKDVALSATNVTITSAQNTGTSEVTSRETSSGLMGSGFGVSIGSRAMDRDTVSSSVSNVGSSVGSVSGNVTIAATDRYAQTGSSVLAPGGDISISAKTVDINAAYDTSSSTDKQSVRQSGLTLALTAPAITALQTVRQMSQASKQTNDPRMLAMAAATAGSAVKDAYSSVSNMAENPQDMSGVKITLSVGSSKSDNTVVQTAQRAVGSNVGAGGNVSIVASGAGQQSNISAVGSTISAGNNIALKADNQINLLAAQNTSSQHSTNSSSGASLGIGFAMGGSQNGFTLEAGINKGRGNADGSDITNVSTKVRAGNTVSLGSGGDTTLKGATVTGNTVSAKVGGDLNIESLQDTSKYDSKQQSAGVSVSVCVPPFCYGASSASGNVASSKVKGDFASVTEQSGIKAGEGGFDVAVKGNTDLKGGVIESSQKAIDDNKNRLTTGTLTQSSIQNHDNYDASGFSVSGSVSGKMGDQTPTNSMSDANRTAATSKTKPGGSSGISSNSGSQGSTTLSGISGGALNITNDDAQRAKTGQSAAEAVASVNRDVSTDKDTSGALTKSWDGGKLMQQTQAEVQITAAFGSAAAKAIGDYGDLQLKQARALRNAAASEPDAEKRDAMLSNAQSIEDKWGESGTARVGAHALVGGITGGLQGALGAGTSAALASSLNNLMNNADLPEPLKQSVGAALASAAGALAGGANGAAAAFNEDVNNRQSNHGEQLWIKKQANGDAKKEARLAAAACAVVNRPDFRGGYLV
ncbi:filamentous hemagglutinin protein [Herbaspirillum rubrisubalbicans M1]|uniref:two-partner secretion domain-containing protein n=1 Tax=Herbaspirillum rubrisubalbicans TaxID=80842 RepID=UPI00073A126B|nr:hemagglutinin repeat-containing protein [Herbaspirillum rubrisubalbicans]ALU91055.1 filamentous hemagglutinin protein [Herbaspirillum rubrisubalbicans M1]